MTIAKAQAPGKVILLGEHAVVYGKPALAFAIQKYSYCTIESTQSPGILFYIPAFQIHLEFNSLDTLMEPSLLQYVRILQEIRHQYALTIDHIKITLISDLWMGAGLGSSASIHLAFLVAVKKFYNLPLSLVEINSKSKEMEQIIHGNPSGIDNTTCCFGGMLFYQNGIFRKLDEIKDFPVLVIYSNQSHNTSELISNLSELKTKNPSLFQENIDKIGNICHPAVAFLQQKNYVALGKLMYNNHCILVDLHLSTPEIEKIIKLGRDYSLSGMKLTGAGGGGCVIALDTPDRLQQFSQKIMQLGYPSFMTNIDYNGVSLYA